MDKSYRVVIFSFLPHPSPRPLARSADDEMSMRNSASVTARRVRKPPFLAVKRPAHPYKSTIEPDLHRKTIRALKRPGWPGQVRKRPASTPT
jgi:hypothetical protein